MLAVGMPGFGPLEIGLIIVVLLMVFGASRLVDIGSSLGKGIREFRRTVKEDDEAEAADGAPSADQPSSTAAGAAPTGRFCSNCGAELSAETKFCAKCGAPTQATVK
ncbi:MAG: twin-arginine translocase TatA/TatE family subunit [Dehalococcoidia bacterium]